MAIAARWRVAPTSINRDNKSRQMGSGIERLVRKIASLEYFRYYFKSKTIAA
jgi:hypothetical protein